MNRRFPLFFLLFPALVVSKEQPPATLEPADVHGVAVCIANLDPSLAFQNDVNPVELGPTATVGVPADVASGPGGALGVAMAAHSSIWRS